MENRQVVSLDSNRVDEIKEISAKNPYSKGKRATAGKTYSTFSYDGVVFNVEDSTGFGDALKEGNVHAVKLLKYKRQAQLRDDAGQLMVDEKGEPVMGEVDAFEFDTFVHFNKVLNRAKQGAVLNTIAAVAQQADKLDEGAVKAIMSITV